jgi:hypothetical protein
MRRNMMLCLISITVLILPAVVFAQAFGEYGRAVGSLPHGPGITGGKAPGGVSQGGGMGGSVGDAGGRALPTRLIVVSASASLYPRQDEETEKVAQLSQGETLVPMVQAAGGSGWYMVKTPKGIVGWVRGADVREDQAKK